jgi:hypothetical protein
MKHTLIYLIVLSGILACKKSEEAKPMEVGVFTLFLNSNGNVDDTISNPVLKYSDQSSSGCTTKGSITLTGKDVKGRPVELQIYNLTTLEGSNTTKVYLSTSCETKGYLYVDPGTSTTNRDFLFAIEPNLKFTYNKSNNSISIDNWSLVSLSTFNAVTINATGNFN